MDGKRNIIFLFLIILSSCLFISGCLDDGESENGSVDDSQVIRGATFYIDDYGEAKASDEEVVLMLAEIIRNFHIIGLQGISDPDSKAMDILIKEINNGTDENGKAYNYQYNLSDSVGLNSDSKEQYAYIYDRNVLYPSSIPRIYADNENAFNYDPYMIAFRSYAGQGDVLFIVLTIDENNTKQEIDALPQLIENVKIRYAGHENITIVGNLHSDRPYYDETSDSPLRSDDFVWIITNDMVTSTKGNYTYDRIIATSNLKNFYAGKAGVFNFTEEYNLTQEETEAISTHYPVYVEYYSSRPR
ncbi:hypothetical protein [Methanimicrococcus hacksteinii]|nr:hypothetical protein [Methanimicrococcus sp. At1]